MDTPVVNAGVRRAQRRHDPEVKRQVIEACQQPGVSVAAIALANGLNANYLRRWVKEHRDQFGRHEIAAACRLRDWCLSRYRQRMWQRFAKLASTSAVARPRCNSCGR